MTTNTNPLVIFKNKQKDLAQQIRKDHDDWDSVVFRHQHIAYCELRGRQRIKIEKPADNNKPNDTWIDTIKEELTKQIEEWRTE